MFDMNMKTMKYLNYLLSAVLVLCLASCQEEPYAPGEADRLDCQGLFFPQEQAAHYELSPEGNLTLSFSVERTLADVESEIPFTMESSVEDMFEMEEDFFYFDEDQKRATFKVMLTGDYELGETYSCTIKVTDPQYVSIYGLASSELTFTVAVVKWEKFVNNGKSTGYWRDDFFTSYGQLLGATLEKPYLEKEIEIYERSDRKGYYRIDNVYTSDYLSQIFAGDDSYTEALKEYCPVQSIFIDATDPEKVFIDFNFAFYDPFMNFGAVYICSHVEELFYSGFSNQYGRILDGNITFPKESVVLYLPSLNNGGIINANLAKRMRIVLPGYEPRDYFVTVTNTPAENGVMSIDFTLDPDVAVVKYKVFEGHLNDVEMVAKLDEVRSGSGQLEIRESGKYDFTAPVSGFYTLIACSFDAAGNYRDYDYIQFGYDTASDPKEVDIHMGLIVSDKHAATGRTAENSMEYYVYGSDIQEAKVALYKKIHYEDFRDAIDSEFEYYITPLDDYQLDSLNRYGYTGVVEGLTPGTEYILVVYADNGYHSGYFTATAQTEGVFDLMDAEFSFYDIPTRLQPDSHDAYFKEWQLWSLDPYTATRWGRQKRGTVKITDAVDVMFDKSGQVTKDPALAETTMDYVNLEGMHPNLAKLGLNDVIDFEYYEGFIYSLMTPMDAIKYEGKTVYPTNAYLYFNQGSLSPYLENGAMIGGFLTEEKDVIAFVGNPQASAAYVAMQLCYFEDQSYSSNGYLFEEDAHAYPLLVSPDSEYASYGTSKTSLSLAPVYERVSAELAKGQSNCVETARGYIMSTIDRVRSTPYNYMKNSVDVPVSFEKAEADFTLTRSSR